MTWSDEVHNSRFQMAIGRATAERKLRKRGLPVPVMETAQIGPVVAMVALASSVVAWQQWGAPMRAAMARNPLVQQFRALVFGSGTSAPRQVGTKGGAKGGKGGPVAARRPAVVAPTPSQVAAAAAEARLAAAAAAAAQNRQAEAASSAAMASVPNRPLRMEPQPQASTSAVEAPSQASQHSSSSGGASKKKKSSKKRR